MKKILLAMALLLAAPAVAQVITPPLRVYDEASLLPLRFKLKMTGAGVNCVDTSPFTVCTIGGGLASVFADAPLGGDGTAGSHLTCAACTTDVNVQTFSSKSISGASNTFSAIPEAAVTNLTTDLAAKLALTGGTLTGALLFSGDNTLDIGANGATRPRTGYFGTSLIAPSAGTSGAAQHAFPSGTGNLVSTDASQTLTNKTYSGGIVTGDFDSNINAGHFDFLLSTGYFRTSTGTFTFGGTAITMMANTVITENASSTNTTGLKIITNTANGASSVGQLYENTTAITSGDVFRWNNGTGAPVFALRSDFGSTVHELRGANQIFGMRNVGGTGFLAQSGSVFLYSAAAAILEVSASTVNPNTDFAVDLGTSAKRFANTHTRHLVFGQAAVPTSVAGTGAGTGGTCTVLTHGTDGAGILEIVTGAAPAGSGATVCTTAINTFSNKPVCTFSAANSADALLLLTTAVYPDYAAGDTTHWVIKNASVAGISGTLDLQYHCSDSSL